jgi:hypothetical protein
MPLTLTDEQVTALRQEREQWFRDRQIAQQALGIVNDPKTSDRAKALWKEAYPEARDDAYETKQELTAKVDKFIQDQKDEKKTAKDEADKAQWAADRKSTQEARSFTDDAMERLEKFMVDRGISNYEDAADLWVARNPKPTEDTGYADRYWNHTQQDQFEQIAKDPEKYAEREIIKAIRTDMNNARNR